MRPIKPSLQLCIVNAFTQNGLKGVAIITGALCALLIYLWARNREGRKTQDERNFQYSKLGTYGTAGWMDDKEVKSVLEITDPAKSSGIILGQQKGKAVCLPENTRLNKHIMVIGASGTMKSRAFIRNAILQVARRGDGGESIILTDPKSELYGDMSEYLRSKGYDVKVFNLTDPRHSDSWNCMADLNGDTLMAQILTDVIIANTRGDGKGDHFWDSCEANLLKALILAVDQDASRRPEDKHLPAVYQMLTQNTEKQLSAMMEKLPLHHPARAPYNFFQQASDTVRTGVFVGLGTRLQLLQSKEVGEILRYSDIDLTEPARKKCAYFIIISDQENSMDFVSSLFFTCLFIKLVRFADASPGGRCPIPVNLLLDEFNNIGTLGGGGGNDGGRSYARSLSTIRSRAINVCMAIQSLGQLQNRYPNNIWLELIGNCDTQIMLGCTDPLTADYTSVRAGDITVQVQSTMTVRQTFAVAQVIPQYRMNESIGKRRLLMPDEVLRLPQDEMLVMLRGHKTLKLKKMDYTLHPDSAKLKPCQISDYTPMRRGVDEPVHAANDTARKKRAAPLYETAAPPVGF